MQLRQGLLLEHREQAVVVLEAGPAVALVEEAVAASVHFLVVRLAQELVISRDKMTVRRAQEIEVLVFQMKAPEYSLGLFLLLFTAWRAL